MSTVECSLCKESVADAGSKMCRCGQRVCETCTDNSNDVKDKICSFNDECKKKAVKVCAGCADFPLCDTHMWLNAYACTLCGGFACEECFVEDFVPNQECKSKRGCIACGACEMWDSDTNPRQKCRNCLEHASKGCISCGGRNNPKRASCTNCSEERRENLELLTAKKRKLQDKYQQLCGYHQKKVLCPVDSEGVTTTK